MRVEENGYATTMDRVKQYHKENPHVIPNPRQVGQWQDYADKEEDG